MNPKAVITIAQHHCRDSQKATDKWFYDIIQEGINGNNGYMNRSEAVRPFMNLFMGILEMEDELSQKRIEDGVELFLTLMKSNLNNMNRDTFDRLAHWIPKLSANFRFKVHLMKREQKIKLVPLLEKGGYALK